LLCYIDLLPTFIPTIMKNLLILFSFVLMLCSPKGSDAQSFTMLTDTIYITATPAPILYFDSVVIGTSPVGFKWKVIDCNFPPDWLATPVSAFCDKDVCRYLAFLWPSGFQTTTTSYPAGDTAVLDLALDLSTATSTGCFYVTVRLYNPAIVADSADETFIICFPSTLAAPAISPGNKVAVFPNPAGNELNVTYDKNAGVQIVKVFDILGKEIISQPCTDGHISLNMLGVSKGVYYVQLLNDKGTVVVSRKFVKD
jgi:Secretion system C-terminal sorting domain